MFRKKQKEEPIRRSANPQSQGKVFSYYSGNVRPQQGQAPEQAVSRGQSAKLPTKSMLQMLPTYLAGLGAAVGLLYMLSVSSSPRIVLGEGQSDYRDPKEYAAKAEEIVGESVLNKNKVTFQQQHVSKRMAEAFPEMKSATADVSVFQRRPVIRANLQPARFVLVTNASQAFVIDDTGTAIVDAKNIPSSSKLPTIQDESSLAIKTGQNALSSQEVRFITTVLSQLQAKDISPKAVVLPAIPGELQVRLQDYYIKFNMREDPRQSVGAFLAAKGHLEEQREKPKEYVDARVYERVFYK